jgi:hypothetical protein
LTKVNLKVKIHIVDGYFVGDEFQTNVWVSEKARSDLDEFSRERDGVVFLAKLENYAKAGFHLAQRNGLLRTESRNVLAFGHKGSKFRLLGFFESYPALFIAIDSIIKRGQKPGKAQDKRIDEVADVKANGRWQRRN